MNKKTSFKSKNNSPSAVRGAGERGSAIVLALLIMALLMVFMVFAMARTNSETLATGNDAAEGRAHGAAEASLEVMTNNFKKKFDVNLDLSAADETSIEKATPENGLEKDYNFRQIVTRIENDEEKIVPAGKSNLTGLNSTRSRWRVDAVATDKSTGVEVALRREFYNYLVPIFQFGMFYEDDLEAFPGPRFDFGGRVHSNANMYLMAQSGLYFSSKVTSVGHIVTQKARNGRDWNASDGWSDQVYIKRPDGEYERLYNNRGSVLSSGSGTNVFAATPNVPAAYLNDNWESGDNFKAKFGGNLLAKQPSLNLPLKGGKGKDARYIEMIKRGKDVGDVFKNPVNGAIEAVKSDSSDSNVTRRERYANKAGLRISLADKQTRLPGCQSKTVTAETVSNPTCGIQLDGDVYPNDITDPLSLANNARGYKPKAMTDYQATTFNAERLPSGKEAWIKVEMIEYDPKTASVIATDVTADVLSLGVTEQAAQVVDGTNGFSIVGYHDQTVVPDSRSVIELQRFQMPGFHVKRSDQSDSEFTTKQTWNGTDYNFVQSTLIRLPGDDKEASLLEDTYMRKAATVNGAAKMVVPFPIKMFDTREGLQNDSISSTDINTKYPNGSVPHSGVMSMVQINVGNLKRFLSGEFNNKLPTGTLYGGGTKSLKSGDIPQKKGWVLYVSDRRGDADFDGEYDMEDIYQPNPAGKPMQFGEDVNNNGILDVDASDKEAPLSYNDREDDPAKSAVFDHKYYRRGVRLRNAEALPGVYDSSDKSKTRGFTVASENAVYVLGNYNSTGITEKSDFALPSGQKIDCSVKPTPSSCYLPQDSTEHIPASIVADAVVILSKNWTDSRSFRYPFSLSDRLATETTVRFAMISGDPISRTIGSGESDQGGKDIGLGGGVHNFKRTLEKWTSLRLNYTGSIINLYNAHNNNSAFKCCIRVYDAPSRNWVFDQTFLNPSRLPPGTPFIQMLDLTGFQRVNEDETAE